MEFELIKNILSLSNSKEWETAKKEWELIEVRIERGKTCLCGKYPITELCIILNKLNNNKAIVGNCCINKFLEMKGQNKVFKSLQRGKVNKSLIELSAKKFLITPIERDFLLNVWRKKKLSEKQRNWFDALNKRIIEKFKDGNY